MPESSSILYVLLGSLTVKSIHFCSNLGIVRNEMEELARKSISRHIVCATALPTGWQDEVSDNLSFLPELYPEGDKWLEKRLFDIDAGRALCFLAYSNCELAGVSILTPKQVGVVKLSTLFVGEDYRSQGLGHSLLEACTNTWLLSRLKRAYVTVAESRIESLAGILFQHSFKITSFQENRYGNGRNEFVFEWANTEL